MNPNQNTCSLGNYIIAIDQGTTGAISLPERIIASGITTETIVGWLRCASKRLKEACRASSSTLWSEAQLQKASDSCLLGKQKSSRVTRTGSGTQLKVLFKVPSF
ncbi:hypothetical protein SESBI_17088 [Sesbania bispinosa]|nr:hypothetical protein SESBI_17088 [Sesbania bispinosa]